MATKKNSHVIYKRDKSKIEISGEPEQVKWPMWFDLVSSRLFWLVLVIILLVVAPKMSWLPVILQWLKKQIPFLLLFITIEGWSRLLLSG